ncbi:hypothetical protein MUK60_22595 [Streptomyces sp. LRE541]|uniref:hypothetical protein n=1 Tax=Streptomyces sp. LRE541 TaxID=2931983 RepID=UPI002010A8BA|nr:hypothetical protein [Streptomyces sp. LRE541]UPZ30323.1 hypothetical protein MUK60_22595 [Streptomyces sp. LRE541]
MTREELVRTAHDGSRRPGTAPTRPTVPGPPETRTGQPTAARSARVWDAAGRGTRVRDAAGQGAQVRSAHAGIRRLCTAPTRPTVPGPPETHTGRPATGPAAVLRGVRLRDALARTAHDRSRRPGTAPTRPTGRTARPGRPDRPARPVRPSGAGVRAAVGVSRVWGRPAQARGDRS